MFWALLWASLVMYFVLIARLIIHEYRETKIL